MDLSVTGMSNCSWWFKAFSAITCLNGAIFLYAALKLTLTLIRRKNHCSASPSKGLMAFLPHSMVTASSIIAFAIAHNLINSIAGRVYEAASKDTGVSYTFAYSDALDVAICVAISLLPAVLALFLLSLESGVRGWGTTSDSKPA